MRSFFTILFILFSLYTKAQLLTVTEMTTYPFWLNIPTDTTLLKKVPIVVFLHGKSLSGTDLNRVKKYGLIKEIENGRNIPALVAAPQLASGPWNPDNVLEIIQYLQKTYQTDSSKIYIVGMSLGGYGTLHFVGKHADKITAAIALCGGGNVKDVTNLASIPLWIQHGNADKAVPISESEKIVNAIKKENNGVNLKYTIWKGGGHGTLERAFHQDEFYEWLFDKSKKS